MHTKLLLTFKFHTVQLKVGKHLPILHVHIRFKFHTVQLKGTAFGANFRMCFLFKFHTVQLKGRCGYAIRGYWRAI